MKKTFVFILPVCIFIPTLFYLHQKVQIHIEAYRLSNTYHCHNELIDRRDYLMYNFSKEISLVKINRWAQNENLTPVDKSKVLALNIKAKDQTSEKKTVSLLGRLLKASSSASTALAKEGK
jgi:hypothetical protein